MAVSKVALRVSSGLWTSEDVESVAERDYGGWDDVSPYLWPFLIDETTKEMWGLSKADTAPSHE